MISTIPKTVVRTYADVCCTSDCFDNGDPEHPAIGFRRDTNYGLTKAQIERFLAVGLFPECFGPAVAVFHVNQPHEYYEESVDFWNEHIDEWEERARKERVLPFRATTEKEDDRIAKMMKERAITRHAALKVLIDEQGAPKGAA